MQRTLGNLRPDRNDGSAKRQPTTSYVLIGASLI
jgi:hypothetical protein